MVSKSVQFSIFVIQSIIVSVGTISNILSFIVWTKGKICRTLPIAVYFRILAAVDTFILLIPGVELLLYLSPYGKPLRNLNSVTCRLYPGLTSSTIRISSWVISSFTIERTLYIYFPTKFRTALNSTRTLVITTCLVLGSLLMDLPIFIRSELVSSVSPSNITLNETVTFNISNQLNATRNTEGNMYCKGAIFKVEIIIDGLAKFLLPFLILVSCNTLILTQFRRQYRFSMTMGNQKGHDKRQVRYRNAIYQMVSISFFHCVSTAPWSITAACGDFGEFFNDLILAFNTLVYLNSAINVLLYCFIGNDFRRDLKYLFCTKNNADPPLSQLDTVTSKIET